jgi:hypothetical protein
MLIRKKRLIVSLLLPSRAPALNEVVDDERHGSEECR